MPLTPYQYDIYEIYLTNGSYSYLKIYHRIKLIHIPHVT